MQNSDKAKAKAEAQKWFATLMSEVLQAQKQEKARKSAERKFNRLFNDNLVVTQAPRKASSSVWRAVVSGSMYCPNAITIKNEASPVFGQYLLADGTIGYPQDGIPAKEFSKPSHAIGATKLAVAKLMGLA